MIKIKNDVKIFLMRMEHRKKKTKIFKLELVSNFVVRYYTN